MQNLNWKDVAEMIGIGAIVASLIFVGLQMRQTQDVAISEGGFSFLSSRIESRNSIISNGPIWLKGLADENLTETEYLIFEKLLRNETDVAFYSSDQLRRLGYDKAAEAVVHDFSAFLHQHPGAKRVFEKGNDVIRRNREVLMPGDTGWSWWREEINSSLKRLDAFTD